MKVKNGIIISVANKKRQPTASAEYLAVWIEDNDGRNERHDDFRRGTYHQQRGGIGKRIRHNERRQRGQHCADACFEPV